jgi:hypothetical protein
MISQERHGREMGQHTKAKWVQAVYVSNGRINVLLSECLNLRTAEAQRPAARAARSRLQLALHAQRTAGLLHEARSAIRSGTRYAKWTGGSRSQTHRRAAMCGFTQDDGYVRGVAPTH